MTKLNIIVTGGFGELGTAVSQAFARNGHNVCRVDFASSPTTIDHTLDLAGINLTKPLDCEKVANAAKNTFGGIDVLVNIAGGFYWGNLDNSELSDWERMFGMNLLTAVSMTKAALPEIQRSQSGRIINIGAIAALSADAGMGAYAASKSGIHRFTESLAKELSDSSTTVNAILPSTIDTKANRAAMPDADTNSWVTPNSIADVILFLSSPAAQSISGALIPVSKAG